MNDNKSYGKVTDYNGIYGNIKGTDGNNYELLDKNVIDKEIKESDIVEFEGENFKTPEIETNIARFVKKLKR